MTKNAKSIDDVVLIAIIVLSFSPVLIYLFADRFQSPVPPALIAFMISAGISALVYRFLGGISTDTSFSNGAIKVGGSMAALLASWFLLNGALVDYEGFNIKMSVLEEQVLTLESTNEVQANEIQDKNQFIKEQADKIQELEVKLAEMNKDIAMNPSAAMSFLPYALRTIGASDGTIDCATSLSYVLKDLACQQIQTLLNSVDRSYKETVPRKEVRSQLARYQSDLGLDIGRSDRRAGMLDEQTLKRLIQDRLDVAGVNKKAEDYFP